MRLSLAIFHPPPSGRLRHLITTLLLGGHSLFSRDALRRLTALVLYEFKNARLSFILLVGILEPLLECEVRVSSLNEMEIMNLSVHVEACMVEFHV